MRRHTILILTIIPFIFLPNSSSGQPLTLTTEQAVEDFNWLRFALTYVHPRLYKYDNKATVDERFDSLVTVIKSANKGIILHGERF